MDATPVDPDALSVTGSAGWTVVVLTGGGSRRMGRDKATLVVAGETLLERTLAGVPPDVPVVVAGPTVPLSRPAVFVQEDPPGGGPVAGIEVALRVVTTPVVVVLSADLPLVGGLPAVLAMAVRDEDLDTDGGTPHDAVLCDDAAGRAQPLCAAYRTDELRRAILDGGPAHGASVHSVIDRLRWTAFSSITIGSAATADPAWDIDTPEDLQRLHELLDQREDD